MRSRTERLGDAVHAVRITTDAERDGLVYNADETPIGNRVGGDGKTWSNISIHKGSQGSPEEDESASDVVHRYAKQIVGAVMGGRTTPKSASLSVSGSVQDTQHVSSHEQAIAPVQDRIRGQSIAIIGLGGTGAYVLDLVAKTPVQ